MNEFFELEVLESESTLDFTDPKVINQLNQELGI
jgi:hypothetical protein